MQGLGAGHHRRSSKESVFKEISNKGFIFNLVLQIFKIFRFLEIGKSIFGYLIIQRFVALNVAFKLQGLSAIFMAAASSQSRCSAAASVLGEIELKATHRVYFYPKCCF